MDIMKIEVEQAYKQSAKAHKKIEELKEVVRKVHRAGSRGEGRG